MKVVDELLTPGCPQCAIKHLSAALYHRARLGAKNESPSQAMVCLCTAAINLVEVMNGYTSHLWYAIGALERAEECALMTSGAPLCAARDARLLLEERGVDGAKDALVQFIGIGARPSHSEWAAAHFDEAVRELPIMAEAMRMDDLIGSIEQVRREFFGEEKEVSAASSECAGKGGE